MKQFKSTFRLVLLILVGISTLLTAAEKKAFVVGVGNYASFTKLNNAPNDARLMSKALVTIGFTIHGGAPLIDPGAEALQQAFMKFTGSLNDQTEVVIFFAGHGLQSGGDNLLIPADFAIDPGKDAAANARMARLQSLQLGNILTALEQARVPTSAIFLDCCRDPGFMQDAPGLTLDGGLAEPGKKSLSNGELLICFAAKHGQTASDGVGQNSPFTSALAKRITTPGSSLRVVFDEVTADVLTATHRRQQPFSYGTLTKDLFLAGLPSGVQQIGAAGALAIGAPATVAQLVAKIEPGKSHADMRSLMGKPAKSHIMRKADTGVDGDVLYESYVTKHYGTQLFYAKSADTGAWELSAFTVHLHEGQALPIYRGHADNTLFVLGRTTASEAWKNAGEPTGQFEAGGGRFPAKVGTFYLGRQGNYLTWLIPFPEFQGEDQDAGKPIVLRSCGACTEDSWAEFLSEFVAAPISWMEPHGADVPANPEAPGRSLDQGMNLAPPPTLYEFIDGESNFRTGPGTSHPVKYQPANRTICARLDSQGQWIRLRLADGDVGWAHQQNLRLHTPSARNAAATDSNGTGESYVVSITGRDFFNSNGVRLVDPVLILMQDRANVHKFGNPDGDPVDRFFSIPDNRAQLRSYLAQGSFPESIKTALANGVPTRLTFQLAKNASGQMALHIRNAP